MKYPLRTAMLAAMLLAPMGAMAETMISASIFNTDVEAGGVDATPRSLALEARFELSDLAWVGAQFVKGIQGDEVAPGDEAELDNAMAARFGVQHAFTDAVKGYAYLGFGTAKISTTSAGSADGTSFQYGLGATFYVGEMGDADAMLDVGWSVLFDDDMSTPGGDIAVKISGPHIGFGLAF